jgi:metal-dependent amidase/aminoacylase/carboxypeptidase family protein
MQSFASRSAWLSASVLLVATAAQAAHESMPTADAIYPDLERLYLDLHQNPELSWHEEKTAAKLAAQLRSLGYEVTAGVAKIGVVGLLRNGKGRP